MSGSLIDRFPKAEDNISFQRCERVGADRVVLKIRDHGDGRQVLERTITRPDEVGLTLVLPLRSEKQFWAFATADPWIDILEPGYQAIHAQSRPGFNRQGRSQRQERAVGVNDRLGQILEYETEFDLGVALDSLVGSLGAEQYCVSWIDFDSRGDTVEHRYLVGCDPAWMQKYIHRSGYMNDPLLEYAKRNAAPATISGLGVDVSEHWLLQEAQRHGMESVLTCPVHERARSAVSILQVTVSRDGADGDRVLLRNQFDWRSTASTLSEWRLRRLREAAARCGLQDEDLTVLRALLHWKDSSAETIAAGLDMRARHVRQVVYPRITEKLRVAHIKDAVTIAFKCGLIN
ncbi:autoinducer binding domain-containing protein [Paraburkholderia sp. BL23I1N1]|uniref:autoinducer binding domain-containing protein n=1 Tax=Paraburkholderia sp. BL23I1N1 TaxID=1938802 RepID=UPI000FF0B445|nr:autoinducer binding domain-containing protein [Paraburkholderia sp. BL23I1N1]RKE23889.1 autoinducer binding domain-containing protein [Paraburkholderia sp. BL23I1N1]